MFGYKPANGIKADKRIDNRMNRILLILLLLCACFAGCKKTDDAAAQIKAQLAVDDKAITDYLAARKINAQVIDSAGISTGIYYTIDTLGTGNDLFTNSTVVTVGYKGRMLLNDSVFVKTDNFHPSFVLGSVIRGWQLGIPQDKENGSITLYVPSHYAYGPFAQAIFGNRKNVVLIFNIKLYNITN